MRNTMKRVSLVVAMVLVAGALGACADEPTGVEESYTVQMNESNESDCYWVNGRWECDE